VSPRSSDAIHDPPALRRIRIDPRQQGMVLLLVLFFILLLTASIASFVRRSTMDAAIVRNRDRAMAASSLARGGIRIAQQLLTQNAVASTDPSQTSIDFGSTWQGVQPLVFFEDETSKLVLRIEDTDSRLNVNALLDEQGNARPEAHDFLEKVLAKVINEMPGTPEEKLYDPAALAWNLLDYIDVDEIRERWDGGQEDDFYAKQVPPGHAANRPLLDVDELRLVEGFDTPLVSALEPYLTVFPYAGGGGINPNTAPPYVLGLLYHWPYGEASPAETIKESAVQEIIAYREEGNVFCSPASDTCSEIESFLETERIFPTPSYTSSTFRITAEASVDDIQRSIEVVLATGLPDSPEILLFWREY